MLKLTALALLLALGAATAASAQTTTEWDGLARVQSPNFDAVFLAPGAEFSGYTKVMLDPTEVAFRRDWLSDHNQEATTLTDRISTDEARQILETAQRGVQEVFAEEYARGGYQVVTTPGPDVLRIRTAVANLEIAAPENMSRSRTYSREAGQATIVIEVRDSMSGALLGRGVDHREVDEGDFMMRRTRTSNRADFENTFRTWAQLSVQALTRLKATTPPPAATGMP
jgi:hypothetical protein